MSDPTPTPPQDPVALAHADLRRALALWVLRSLGKMAEAMGEVLVKRWRGEGVGTARLRRALASVIEGLLEPVEMWRDDLASAGRLGWCARVVLAWGWPLLVALAAWCVRPPPAPEPAPEPGDDAPDTSAPTPTPEEAPDA